jgi:hypothetical protein
MIFSSLLSRIVPHKTKANRFFGLVLRESSATGYAFEQTESDVEILKSKQFPYSKNFEKVLDDTDAVIYEFETALKMQFNKVIFVLPVCGLKGDGKEVVQPYRGVISEIIHNLELEAMGYIEMTDVLKEELKKHDSAVYIEVGKLKTQIVFLRNGEKWNQLSINTNPANVASHLTEFITKGTNIYVYSIHESANTNALMAALSDYVVHLYKPDELSVDIQQLLKKQLLPQVEATLTPGLVSEEQEVTERIENTPIVDGSSDMVIDSQTIAVDTVIPPVIAPASPIPGVTPDSVAGFKIFTSQSKRTDDGYVHGPPHESEKTSKITSSFPVADSVVTDVIDAQPPEEVIYEPDVTQNEDELIIDNEVTPKNSKRKFVFKSIGMSIGIIVCIALAGIIVFELYLHKVTVKISVPTETFAIKQALSSIPVSKVVEEKQVDVSVDTTGQKEVGERAKGTIVLASFDDKEASFSAGTQLYLDDSVYKLDADVVLPPATVDTSSGTKQASKKSVAASATFIGTDGNIVKGKQLSVEDYPSSLYYALSEADFSGGSQQTVSVVAEEDIAKLNVLVKAKAKETSESAKAGASGDSVTLDEISSIDMSELSYSSDVGEVASVVKAEGSVKAVLYTTAKGALVEVLQKAVNEDKGKNFQFLNADIKYAFSDVVLATDEQTCDMNLETTLDIFKSLDTSAIKKSIRMKLDSQASQVLKDKYKVSEIQFVYNPVLPLFQLFVPYRTENIEVEIDPVGSASTL